MAHIFKHPENGQKGIIIFSHKEWGFFTGNKITKRLKREGRMPKILYRELRPPYAATIQTLKYDYYIGVHFGAYYPHFFTSKIADFVLSRESNLPQMDNHLLRLPFNSRDFTPVAFEPSNTTKSYDVMTVAQNVKVKNYPLLFQAIKSALAIRPTMTFLLITPSQAGVSYGVEKNIAEQFYASFTRAEQSQITFLFLHPDLQWGIDQQQLVEFYNRSRVFTLFSKQEGESRVISEALCCRLPVVAYQHLLGGGTDLLTPHNSVLFEQFSHAHLAWIKALETFPAGVLEETEKLTREDHSLIRLNDSLQYFYAQQGAQFDGKLINTDSLYRRLPAHHYDVPWMIKGKPTADVLTGAQFRCFIDQLITSGNSHD